MWAEDDSVEEDLSLMLVPHVCLEGTVAQERGVEEAGAHRHQMSGEIQEEISIQIARQWVSWQRWRVESKAAGDRSTGRTGT